MKNWKKIGCIVLAFLLLLVIGGVLVLVVNYKTAIRELRADHDEGVKLIREYLSDDPARPVLRGEALPGNGGPKLAEILAVIESEQAEQPWALLLRDARGELDADSKARALSPSAAAVFAELDVSRS